MQKKGSHFIDTCVFLEIARKSKLKETCKRYLARIGSVYDGFTSNVVLGEYAYAIYDKENKDFLDCMELLSGEITLRKINVLNKHNEEIYEKFVEITDLLKNDYKKIGLIDRLLLACAEVNGIDVFVSLDGVIVDNEILQKNLRIKLAYPDKFL